MLFSLLKLYLDTDTALKVSYSVYCFTTSISHGVGNYFITLYCTGISDLFLPVSLNPGPISFVIVFQKQGTQYFCNYVDLFSQSTCNDWDPAGTRPDFNVEIRLIFG